MNLATIGPETVAITHRGHYVAPSGARVELRDAVAAAVRGTVHYAPDALAGLVAQQRAPDAPHETRIEVTAEGTGDAARRLVEREGCARVVALNFASAKNAGGGFLGAARAQEEALCRCSALYPCLLEAPGYYEHNRALRSGYYSDHAIYAPDVPFFRDDRYALLEAPFALSVITSPAPNAGVAHRDEPDVAAERLRTVLRARAAHVLGIARAHAHATLVLGAWGCGVFRNDPRDVAEAFATALESARFKGAFARVVFAVYAPRKGDAANLRAFEARFGAR